MLFRDRIVHLIAQQWPATLITSTNPLFEYEARHIHVPKLKRFLIPLILAMLLLLDTGYRVSIGRQATITSWLLLASSLCLSLLCDLRYLSLTVNSISQEVESGQWDLLRLTALRQRDILAAKFAANQIRAWKWMAVDIALRLGVAAFALGMILFWMFPPVKDFYLPRSVPVVLAFYAIFAAIYILEPLWRMRAFVAVGIAVSARIQNHSIALLAGFGLLSALRIVQAIILVIIGTVAMPMVSYLSQWGLIPFSLDLMDLVVYFLVCLLIAGVVYAFYIILEEQALRRALAFAFNIEQLEQDE